MSAVPALIWSLIITAVLTCACDERGEIHLDAGSDDCGCEE